MSSRAIELRRTLLTLLVALPVAALAGSAMSTLGDSFGATKVLWVLVAGAGAAVALLSLRLALAVLVVALAFPFHTKQLMGIDITTTAVPLLIVGGQVLVALFLRRLHVPRGLALPLLMMLAGGVIGSIAGPDPAEGLYRLAYPVLPCALVAVGVAGTLRPERDLRPLALIVAMTLTGQSVLAIAQSLGVAPSILAPIEQARPNGLMSHPNILGEYLSVSILLLVGLTVSAWQSFRSAPFVLAVPAALGAVALVVTLSRGSLLGLAAGILVITIVLAARRRVVAVMSVFLVVLAVLFVVLPRVPESERAAFAQRIEQALRPGAETGRHALWRAAERTIAAHPITGIGPFGFRETLRGGTAVVGASASLWHSHNLYFETWLSLGLLGLLGFLLLLGTAMRRLLSATARARDRAPDDFANGWAVGLLGALTAIAVHGFVDFLFWQVELMVLLFVLIGLAFALGRWAAGSSERPRAARSAGAR